MYKFLNCARHRPRKWSLSWSRSHIILPTQSRSGSKRCGSTTWRKSVLECNMYCSLYFKKRIKIECKLTENINPKSDKKFKRKVNLKLLKLINIAHDNAAVKNIKISYNKEV
jgi:hypothetical protein